VALELLGRDVLPKLRGVEAADPRTLGGGAELGSSTDRAALGVFILI
jgi:hypothetical protein